MNIKYEFIMLNIMLLMVPIMNEVIMVHKLGEDDPTLRSEEISIMNSLSSNPNSIDQQNNFSIKLQRSPVYAYPGIIVDFIVTPSMERTQTEIEDMIQFDVSDSKYLPPRAYISQGQHSEQIRVVFDYQNNIPYKPFVIVFRFNDNKRPWFGEKRIALVMDSILGGISSALHLDYKREDYIR